MQRHRIQAVFLLILLIAGTVSFAQMNDRKRQESEVFNKREKITSSIKDTRWHWGPLSSTFEANLGQIGYDSNIFSSIDGEELGDFVVSPRVGLKSFLRFSPHFIAKFHTQGQYVWYKDLDHLRDWYPDNTVAFYGLFKRVYFELSYSSAKDRIRTNSELIERNENRRTIFSFDSMFQISPRFFVNLSASESEKEYTQKSEHFENNNSFFSKQTLTLTYQKHVRFWPFIEIGRMEAEFKNRVVPQVSESYTLFLGARNQKGRRWHYLIKMGQKNDEYEFQLGSASVTREMDDWTYQLYSSYKVKRHISVEAGINQNAIYSYLDGYTHFLSQRFLLGFHYRFKNDFELNPDLYVGTNKYQPLPEYESKSYDYQSINLNFKIPFGNNSKINYTVGYENREVIQFSGSIKGWYTFIDLNYQL
ncbi:MAG: hypothetical protein CSA81_05945 [Acidobacteria bacterium]|nr:MAG: hypothetical protein CSA81_05945 [Acidobacteriota bacterium]